MSYYLLYLKDKGTETDKLRNLSKIKQLVRGVASIQTQEVQLQNQHS